MGMAKRVLWYLIVLCMLLGCVLIPIPVSADVAVADYYTLRVQDGSLQVLAADEAIFESQLLNTTLLFLTNDSGNLEVRYKKADGVYMGCELGGLAQFALTGEAEEVLLHPALSASLILPHDVHIGALTVHTASPVLLYGAVDDLVLHDGAQATAMEGASIVRAELLTGRSRLTLLQGASAQAVHTDDASALQGAHNARSVLPLQAGENLSFTESGAGADIPEPDGGFVSFHAGAADLLAGSDNAVRFYARLTPGFSPGEIVVRDQDGASVCVLADDGESPDITAADGVYSGAAVLNSYAAGRVLFQAQAGQVYSQPFAISFLIEMNSNSLAETHAEEKRLERYVKSVSPDNAQWELDLVEDFVLQELQSGAAVWYERCAGAIAVRFSSGIVYVYIPQYHSETNSFGDRDEYGAPEAGTAPPGGKVLGVAPYATKGYTQEIKTAAAHLNGAVSGGITYCQLAGGGANVDMLKKCLSGYEVVIWNGHGGYVDSLGSFVMTGEDATAANDETHKGDLLAARLIHVNGGRYAITADFITRYYGSNAFSGTMFYFGTCETANSSKFVDALLSKGAGVVLAYDGSVFTGYNGKAMDIVFQMLSKPDATGRRSAPVSEAVWEVKSALGENDTARTSSAKAPAELKIFGDEEFVFYLRGDRSEDLIF